MCKNGAPLMKRKKKREERRETKQQKREGRGESPNENFDQLLY